MAFAISFVSVPVNALANESSSRVPVQISMITDADTSVETGEIITVTVRWKSVLTAAGEPFILKVTDGAEILVDDISDVVFTANGTESPIRDLGYNGTTVTFMSGTPAASHLDNEITFQVKAPLSAGDFTLSTKIGNEATPNNPMTNFVEKTFSAIAIFYVETSQDVIVGNMPFDIFGETGFANLSGADYMVAFEIHHKDTNKIEIDGAELTDSNGDFLFASRSFPSTAEEGIYIVEAALLDLNDNFVTLRTTQKEIEYVKPVPTITVETTYDDVVADTPFNVFGNVDADDAFAVGLSIYHKESGTIIQDFSTVHFLEDNQYDIGSFAFLDSHALGTYIVEVVLLDSNFVEIATNQKEIRHSEPAPPVAQVPDRIVLDSQPSGTTMATYSFGRLPRVNGNSNITITGSATLNGVPVANAEIVVGVFHPAWTGNQANRERTLLVTTDANGRFSGTIRVSHGVGQYNEVVTVSRHYFDLATVFAEVLSNMSVYREIPIYILAYTITA